MSFMQTVISVAVAVKRSVVQQRGKCTVRMIIHVGHGVNVNRMNVAVVSIRIAIAVRGAQVRKFAPK